MEQYKTGEVIEHRLMPGFTMTVLDSRECETEPSRPESHRAYKVLDPEGNEDWLCGYDVQRPGGGLSWGGAEPAPDCWKLEGYDAFDGTPYPMGTLKRADGSAIDGMQPSYASYEAARTGAVKALEGLERTQPSASSGGQAPGGIQDRVFIVHPDGLRERVTS